MAYCDLNLLNVSTKVTKDCIRFVYHIKNKTFNIKFTNVLFALKIQHSCIAVFSGKVRDVLD